MGQEKLNRVDEEVIKAVGAFGGGIASSGNVCGILLGGVALISSIHSRGNLDEKENPRLWSLSSRLIKEFDKLTEEFGGSNCRDIVHLDWKDRNAVKEYYSNPDSRRRFCIELVGDFAFILGELLEKEAAREK
ncbi:MAG: C-GCAxxG-C-C family protein [Desulfobulbaceae bacterium]|nr:C-GCAxxG-C-C family protein [Desulfobulbaceae bacterium]